MSNPPRASAGAAAKRDGDRPLAPPMFPPHEEPVMTDVDDAFQVVFNQFEVLVQSTRTCCHARLRPVAIRFTFAVRRLATTRKRRRWGSARRKRRGSPYQSLILHLTLQTRVLLQPVAWGGLPMGVVVCMSWLHSCRMRSVTSCCYGGDDAAVVTVEVCRVVVNECMEAAKKSDGVVEGPNWAWRRAFYYLAVESLVNLRQFDGACQFAGPVQGRAGPASTRLPGLRGWAAANANPILNDQKPKEQ